MNNKQIETYKSLVCPTCQKKITEPLQKITDLLNSDSKLDQAKAVIKITRLKKKLWKKLCEPCKAKLLKEIPRTGL